ncbi:MAG: hypothetical protein WD928_10630 [Gammaproteobacteria bacterium]
MMEKADLLERIAATLRHEISPVVGEPYARTQAFMASVVLGKLAAELRLGANQGHDANRELDELFLDLESHAAVDPLPDTLLAALSEATRERSDAGLAHLVEALYGARSALGEDRFAKLLGRIRQTLRARLARELTYAA